MRLGHVSKADPYIDRCQRSSAASIRYVNSNEIVRESEVTWTFGDMTHMFAISFDYFSN
jgi:hypothetical protein